MSADDDDRFETAAIRSQARAWMARNAAASVDRSCNVVNYTALAEGAAYALGHDEWLDVETHEVWELALSVGQAHERSLGS